MATPLFEGPCKSCSLHDFQGLFLFLNMTGELGQFLGSGNTPDVGRIVKEPPLQRRDVRALLDELSKMEGIRLPQKKGELARLKASLEEANPVNPLSIFVGSCPDYSHRNGLYTHEELRDGVSLLAQYHLRYDVPALRLFDLAGVPYVYTLMVADVEAVDEVFCARFTGGDREEFLRRCRSTQAETAKAMSALSSSLGLNGRMVSSSFFRVFGEEKFLYYQEAYRAVLTARYHEDESFQFRVDQDTAQRMEMYRLMYREVIGNMTNGERAQFLAGRTIRTMAQYLTLGRLISGISSCPVVINHPTRNFGMLNDRNKYPLPGDNGSGLQQSIPVIEMTHKVY